MNRIDEIYTLYPFFGTRRMTVYLQKEGFDINRKKTQRLYRIMGLETIYARPKTTMTNKQHEIYPYLLRDVLINKVHQVYSSDITYIRIHNGFAYLVAIIDWFSRYVLGWKLSNSLDADFCIETLTEVLDNNYICDIFNSDQGCQYTSKSFTQVLKNHNISISMDGKGRCLDNVFIERLWRSVKQECVYLMNFQDIKDAQKQLEIYFDFYNNQRIHQSLNYKTPREVFMQKTN
jgi:putative transposase